MKTCFKCGKKKPANTKHFYRHFAMRDGLLGKCKECAKKDSARRLIEKRDEVIKYERKRARLPHRVKARKKYAKTPEGKLAHQKSLRRQIELYPENYKARTMTRNAIRDGKLLKEPCKVCGKRKVEAHHQDYSKPLDVEWLCNKHHRQRHGKQ